MSSSLAQRRPLGSDRRTRERAEPLMSSTGALLPLRTKAPAPGPHHGRYKQSHLPPSKEAVLGGAPEADLQIKAARLRNALNAICPRHVPRHRVFGGPGPVRLQGRVPLLLKFPWAALLPQGTVGIFSTGDSGFPSVRSCVIISVSHQPVVVTVTPRPLTTPRSPPTLFHQCLQM